MEEPLLVTIVGGGLAGFALAAGLHSRGIKAHVFEKSSALTSDTATGISLSRNATVALEGIRNGLSDEMKSVASITKTLKAISYRAGGEETVVVRSCEDGELYVVKWRTARGILARHVSGEYIHFSHALRRYYASSDNEHVVLEFDTRSKLERELQAEKASVVIVRSRFVVGADGINSAVRKFMVGDQPRDLHLLNWNALVYNPGKFNVHAKDEICFMRNGPSVCFLVDTGGDYTMWVFRVEDHDSGSKTGAFGNHATKMRVLQEIDKVQGRSFHTLLRKAVEETEPEDIFERRIKDRLPLQSWSDLNHKVLLIGDAAHAMHWGPGQGARTAFEDAHQLTELLTEAFASGGTNEDLSKAVLRFEEVRIPRLTKFQSFAAETTSIAEFIPEWVKKLPPGEHRTRMNEFQNWASSYPDKMIGDPDSTYFK